MFMGYCDEDITWQFIAIYKKKVLITYITVFIITLFRNARNYCYRCILGFILEEEDKIYNYLFAIISKVILMLLLYLHVIYLLS